MHPLNQWRQDAGLTIREAAEKLDVPLSTFTDWIYMRRFPRAHNMTHIQEVTKGAVTAANMHAAWTAHHRREQEPEAAE